MRWAALACLLTLSARAEVRPYVLAIGNNMPPADSDGEPLAPLHYADDDAADFISFARDFAAGSILLTVLDEQSERRFPELAAEARAPTLAELKKAVSWLRTRFVADEAAGHQPVLLFFFSGHGTRGVNHPPSLALLDAPLTRQLLYDEVLAQLPARYVHLFVDACHAEAVVQPRDAEAQRSAVTAEDVAQFAARATLQRFPHVGAVLATAAGAQAHEWDEYQRGVFSHELISGLRGGADVNGDGVIEYSELSAFLGAANREVGDPRARLSVIVHPPALNRRAPLVDLQRAHNVARLTGRPDRLWIEDEQGNRLADLHAEPQHKVTLILPADRALYVHRATGEALLRAAAGELRLLEELRFQAARINPRGAVEESLHRGLFAATFGPRYYRGFVDQNQELPAVPVADEPVPMLTLPAATPPPDRRKSLALYGVGAGFTVAAAILGGLAADAYSNFQATDLERQAQAAHDRGVAFGAPALATFGVAVVAASLAVWLQVRGQKTPPLRAAR